MEEPKPPPQFWATMIGLSGLVVSILTLVILMTDSNRASTRDLERRLCRLEAHVKTGECGQ